MTIACPPRSNSPARRGAARGSLVGVGVPNVATLDVAVGVSNGADREEALGDRESALPGEAFALSCDGAELAAVGLVVAPGVCGAVPGDGPNRISTPTSSTSEPITTGPTQRRSDLAGGPGGPNGLCGG